jgi:hypothetical protein
VHYGSRVTSPRFLQGAGVNQDFSFNPVVVAAATPRRRSLHTLISPRRYIHYDAALYISLQVVIL